MIQQAHKLAAPTVGGAIAVVTAFLADLPTWTAGNKNLAVVLGLALAGIAWKLTEALVEQRFIRAEKDGRERPERDTTSLLLHELRKLVQEQSRMVKEQEARTESVEMRVDELRSWFGIKRWGADFPTVITGLREEISLLRSTINALAKVVERIPSRCVAADSIEDFIREQREKEGAG